jgi:hypothetical protein
MKAQTADLLAAIEDRTWPAFASEVLASLAPARALEGEMREAAVAAGLVAYRQVLLNVLTEIIRRGVTHFRETGVSDGLVEVWSDMAAGTDQPGGITERTSAVLERLRLRFAAHIAEHLDEITDTDGVRSVLRGGVALRLATEVLQQIWAGAVAADDDEALE